MNDLFVPHHFSFSSISAYLECPNKYAHKYVDGQEVFEDSKATIFGKAFHLALENHYQGKDYRRPMMNHIWSWVLKGKLDKKEYATLVRMGDGMMANVKTQGRQYKPSKTEQMYELYLDHPMGGYGLPVKFKCFIDLETEDDQVVDHKTVAKIDFESRKMTEMYNMQLDLYSMLFRTIHKRSPKRLSIQGLLKRMRKTSVQYYDSEPDLIRETMLFEKVRFILDRIMMNDFMPDHSPTDCRYCRMRAEYLKRNEYHLQGR